jgi:hypothetical protein
MKNFDRQINRDFSNAAILCAGSVYPITGGNDSSRDYWRVTKDKDGKVVKVQDDGNIKVLTYVDENDNYLESEEITDRLSTSGLAALLMNGQSADDLNTVFVASGLGYTNSDGWFAKKDKGKYFTSYSSITRIGYNERVAQEKRRNENILNGQKELAHDFAKDHLRDVLYPNVSSSDKMQTIDPNGTISLGGSKYTIGGSGDYVAGCRLLANQRIVNAAGNNLSVIALAGDTSFIDINGEINSAELFKKYDLELSGPFINTEKALQEYIDGGSFGWVYATVPFGSGTHTINLGNIQRGGDGKVSFTPIGTSTSDNKRVFGVYDNPGVENYNKLLQVYIVTRRRL